MVKLVYCLRRKPGMTREEFGRYWAEVHGPLGARIPGLRRLVQSHGLDLPGGPSDFDGIAELWFDDLPSLQAARGSPEWAASTADETNFVDPGRTASLVSVERRIL